MEESRDQELNAEECTSSMGCSRPGGGGNKKPRAMQEIRMKADEEEEEEGWEKIQIERAGCGAGAGDAFMKGGSGSDNQGGWRVERGSDDQVEGGSDDQIERGFDDQGKGVSTITLHVTEHTVTVRLEARYRPAAP